MACGDNDPLRPYDASGELSISPGNGSRQVDPDDRIRIEAKDDQKITDVVVSDPVGRIIRGRLSEDRKIWHSASPLGAGVDYTVRVRGRDGDGNPGHGVFAFSTARKGRMLRVVLGPTGKTYGVGQPVTARLSEAVKGSAARSLVESGLQVTSRPSAPGRWHWMDDRTLHYRPEHYWPPHATISVESKLYGLKIRDGLYGGPDHGITFRTGDRIEALVDAGTHRMTVSKNGKVLRTIPVTTGKPGFETRNGIKVVLARQEVVRMTGRSIGISPGSADDYDLMVRWAVQVTHSGEYVHAAPWSQSAHGFANVSHGCTGMSMEAAEWFYRLVRPGDIVEVVNSSGEMMPPFGNGFGDWNVPWEKWGRKTVDAEKVSAGKSAARLSPGT